MTVESDGAAVTMVPLPERDLELAIFCVRNLINMRARAGNQVPNWMRDLVHRLDTRYLSSEMSAMGHQSCSASSQLGPDSLISTAEAARMLGLTVRHVRRISADLGGQRVGDALIFERSAVTDYQQVKETK